MIRQAVIELRPKVNVLDKGGQVGPQLQKFQVPDRSGTEFMEAGTCMLHLPESKSNINFAVSLVLAINLKS